MKKKIRNFINILNTIKSLAWKIILFLYFISLLLLSLFLKLKKKNIKICLCTSGKQENNYIREFVEHYRKYGVDKIFLYDNNDINGEYFESIITDYIKLNFVKILNYRGKRAKQLKIFQDCYMTHYNNYDWIIFYDIDEFIYLKNYNNIKDFLIQKKFDKCQSIYLNWVIHTDNNLKHYDNRTLNERFPEITKNKNYCNGKTIIRGYMEGIQMQTTHKLDMRIGRCDGFGHSFKSRGIFCIKPDFKYYYINHYQFKSIEEFINKINKGDGVFGNNNKNKYKRINFFFRFNKITNEKINYIAQKTLSNITILKELIKKINKNYFPRTNL